MAMTFMRGARVFGAGGLIGTVLRGVFGENMTHGPAVEYEVLWDGQSVPVVMKRWDIALVTSAECIGTRYA